MSSERTFLPEIVKTLNSNISSWFSLWNEYHMNTNGSPYFNKVLAQGNTLF